tara:strand:- start:1274 stop:1813 length:540 start_codon:yes stop_codon:yes gene_type:complete
MTKKSKLKTANDQSFIERYFETVLWNTRYIILTGVVFSVLAAVTLFLIGSYEIIISIWHYFPHMQKDLKEAHSELLVHVIGAVDLYLIGVVLMIFGFGIYELFISKIDIAREDEDVTILEIKDLDELKNKIIKVIIMVLIVTFFERVLKMEYSEPLDMLYFAVSIFALSFGVYLIKKHN